MNKIRRHVAGVLAALVLVTSSMWPAREAKAVLPIALVPGVALVFESGTMAASYAASLALIGSVLAYVKFSGDSNNPNAQLRIKISPSAQSYTPAGWTAATTVGGDPHPPQQDSNAPVLKLWLQEVRDFSTGGTSGGITPGQTKQEFETNEKNMAGVANSQYPKDLYYFTYQTPAIDPNGGTAQSAWVFMRHPGIDRPIDGIPYNDVAKAWRYVDYLYDCKKGYWSDEGGPCQLDVEAQVDYPEDGVCEVRKMNGVYQSNRYDPDCNSNKMTNVSGFGTSEIDVTATDRQTKVMGGTDGASIVQWSPGTSGTRYESYGIDMADKLATLKTQDGVPFGQFPTGSGGTGQNGSGWPDDYARAGEAAAAAGQINSHIDALKGSVDGIKDKLTDSQSLNDPTLPAWSDPWGNAFDSLKGWQLPGHTASCPAPSFDWNGHSYAISTHCQLWSDHADTLAGAMVVVWLVAALFLILRA